MTPVWQVTAVAINSVLDFIMTAANLTCLQAEVAFTANRHDILEKDKLWKKEGVK